MRFISPLTHIGRVSAQGGEVNGLPVEPDGSVSLCWASANRDAAVFAQADELQLDRKPNPHLAFGSGPHTCIGALHARTLIRLLLEELTVMVSGIEILSRTEHVETVAQFSRTVGYDALVARFKSKKGDV